MSEYRTEIDTLGEVKVPVGAYYGAQTMRAVENFKVSGIRFQPAFILAQAVIKRSAALANSKAGILDKNWPMLSCRRPMKFSTASWPISSCSTFFRRARAHRRT